MDYSDSDDTFNPEMSEFSRTSEIENLDMAPKLKVYPATCPCKMAFVHRRKKELDDTLNIDVSGFTTSSENVESDEESTLKYVPGPSRDPSYVNVCDKDNDDTLNIAVSGLTLSSASESLDAESCITVKPRQSLASEYACNSGRNADDDTLNIDVSGFNYSSDEEYDDYLPIRIVQLKGPKSLYVTLVSSDGHEFVIKGDLLKYSNTLYTMVNALRDYEENDPLMIFLRTVRSHVLQIVCSYLYFREFYKKPRYKPPEFPLAVEASLEVYMAANFLDV